jgi:hypothetical protein
MFWKKRKNSDIRQKSHREFEIGRAALTDIGGKHRLAKEKRFPSDLAVLNKRWTEAIALNHRRNQSALQSKTGIARRVFLATAVVARNLPADS